MILHKITGSVDQNYWFKLLDTQLNEPINQNLIKDQNFLSQQIIKRYYKNFGYQYNLDSNVLSLSLDLPLSGLIKVFIKFKNNNKNWRHCYIFNFTKYRKIKILTQNINGNLKKSCFSLTCQALKNLAPFPHQWLG